MEHRLRRFKCISSLCQKERMEDIKYSEGKTTKGAFSRTEEKHQ